MYIVRFSEKLLKSKQVSVWILDTPCTLYKLYRLSVRILNGLEDYGTPVLGEVCRVPRLFLNFNLNVVFLSIQWTTEIRTFQLLSVKSFSCQTVPISVIVRKQSETVRVLNVNFLLVSMTELVPFSDVRDQNRFRSRFDAIWL